MDFRISLTGDLGSGKSTVCRILSEKYDAKIYSTGPIVRKIAMERGISVVDINKFMESDPTIDFEMDNRLKLLSDEPGNLIIDSRMAWFFTQGTFKVYLSTSAEESAKRIFNDKQRSSESFETLEETARQIRMRKQSENMRYKTLYGADCGYLGNYDLVVDTTAASAQTVADLIGEIYEKHLRGEEHIKLFLYGGRLKPSCYDFSDCEEETDDAPIKVIIADGEIYIKEKKDHKKVLDYISCGNNLIPCEAEYAEEQLQTDETTLALWQEAVEKIKAEDRKQ
ncbi:MAG: (d)CMP kinase [Clostridia bacterium]|nr:(d)CMP kinase [Clostridia bacterium]